MDANKKAMLRNIRQALVVTLVLLLLCGFVFPVLLSGLSGLLFPHQAGGSLVTANGKAVGAKLVGQEFTEAYFMKGRPSAYHYNTYYTDEQGSRFYNDGSEFAGLGSGSNNYAPSNPALTQRVEADIEVFLAENPGVAREDIPADLMTASGSGLDPHISPAAAQVQLPAIAEASGLSPERLAQIVADNTEEKLLGVFGEETVNVLGFDGIGLDLNEGKDENLAAVEKYGVAENTTLFAGVVNGRNIWRNNYAVSLGLIDALRQKTDNVAVSTASSLLHVPFSTEGETALDPAVLKHFAFAVEKLTELKEIAVLADSDEDAKKASADLAANQALFDGTRVAADPAVAERIAKLTDADFVRQPARAERQKEQRVALGLPLLPTTTIGSFPQTKEIRAERAKLRKGEITKAEYDEFMKAQIDACIRHQEQIGLDVLVHGEFERNDMVEYFGQNLNGFLFTKNAWVQSYGTRCVKPPIVWGDVSRANPITVEWSAYAQSRTNHVMKGMLTGPVTILNWSWPREDITHEQQTQQLALAIRDEVLDLEAAGIKVIQIDEAALREKLPLRKTDWHAKYLDWAIPAFRLVHSAVKPTTQIHTHMCYSEFNDIIRDIDAMDADVISFEASRGDLVVLDAIHDAHFETEAGPGVYDIHSPRIPGEQEIEDRIYEILKKMDIEKVWINPDCGLKTRGNAETWPSLEHMVAAAKAVRAKITK